MSELTKPRADNAAIVSTPGTCGGRARIDGSRITVQNVVLCHNQMGMSFEEIFEGYPQLTVEELTVALAYYEDHRRRSTGISGRSTHSTNRSTSRRARCSSDYESSRMSRSIRFHLDENCDGRIARGLRRRGVDVTTTTDARNRMSPDEAQIAFAHGVFLGLVFEDDVAGILRVAEDRDEPREVGVFLLLPLPADLGLDLDVQGIRRELGEVGVGSSPWKLPVSRLTPKFRARRSPGRA